MSRCLVGGWLERTLCVLRRGIIARERNLKINKKRHPQLCVCCGPHEEDKARRAVCGFLQIVWMKRRSCLACVIIPPHLSLFPDHPLFLFCSLSLCSPSVSPFFSPPYVCPFLFPLRDQWHLMLLHSCLIKSAHVPSLHYHSCTLARARRSPQT